jgi:hypothetical protein
MNFDTPAALSIEAWNKQKAALGKDKSLDDKLSKNAAKVTEALKNLDKARSAVDFSLLDPKGVTTAADAEAALKKLDASSKGNLKNLRGVLKQAGAAADEFAAAVEKIRKSLQGASAAVAVTAMGAATAASKAAPAYEQSLVSAAEAAEAGLQAIVAKAKSQKAPPPAAGTLNKQQLLLKSRFITAMKLAKNPPPKLKLKFAFAVGKTMALCYISKDCGPPHEKLLKGMFPKDDVPKIHRPKDGEVIWEQKKLTFVTDAPVPAGVVKKVALTMKTVFKLPMGLRIRTTAGQAEEAEGEEFPDSALDAADDPKAKAEAAKEYASRLQGLRDDIAKALKGPNGADVQERMASIKSNIASKDFDALSEDLDLLEALLDETPAEAVDVGASGSGGLSVKQLAVARLEWIKSRDTCTSEITRLCKAVADAYRGETAHLPKVREAITRLDGLKGKLKTGLDDVLDKALSENDAARRVELTKAARNYLKSVQEFIEKDELMQNLDGNEILADMRVVAPMKERLSAIEAALG